MTKRWLMPFLLLLVVLASSTSGAAAGAPSLTVRVVGPDRQPIAGATVHAGTASGEEEAPQDALLEKTAADGTVRLEKLPVDQKLHLLIEKKGFFPAYRSTTLRAGERREIRAELQPGGVAVGRVVDEAGRPVAGVEAVLTGPPFGLWPDLDWLPGFLREKAEIRARTGPAGRFRFHDLPEGSFELELRHPDAAPLRTDQPVSGGQGGDLGQFVLRRGTTLSGLVTDPAGRPLGGISVWPDIEQSWPDEPFPPPAAITGPDGRFTLPHLPPGEVSLHLCSTGFLYESESIPFPEEPVHLTLQPGARVRGRVLGPDGAPVAGATVLADHIGVDPGCVRIMTPCSGSEQATSEADGSFSLGPLPPGWYNLLAQAPGLVEGVAEKVRAAPDEPVEGIEIQLREGATVSGRVLDPKGKPVAGAQVMDASSAQAVTAADGSYRLDGIGPEPVTLFVFALGFEREEREIGPVDRKARVDLVLKPEPRDSQTALEGRVLDPGGAPVEGAEISEGGDNRTWSAGDGSFALRVSRWRVRLQISKPGFAPHWTWIDPQEGPIRNLEIRLSPGGVVRGRVLGRTAEDTGPARVRLDQESVPLLTGPIAADGTFRIERVPPGDWTLTAQVGERSASVPVSLTPDQAEASVELELPAFYAVSGRVLDSWGEPVAGARLSLLVESFLRPQGSTRSDGTFQLRLPEGEHQLRVFRQGFVPADLVVRVDQAPVAGLEPRLERSASLRGHILGLGPGDVPRIWGTQGQEFLVAGVGVDGEYSLGDLRPGVWQITVELARRENGPRLRRTIEIPPGATETVLDLDFAQAVEEPER